VERDGPDSFEPNVNDPGIDPWNHGRLKQLDNPIAGRVTVGYGDTASNSTSEVDLSGTTVIGFSEVEDLAGGILFRDKNGELSDTTIGNVFDNLDGLGRDDRIRYDSPSFTGVKFSTSAVADNRWDAAIRYGGDFGPVKTAAAIAGPRRSGFR
jgi:hypothetical protein